MKEHSSSTPPGLTFHQTLLMNTSSFSPLGPPNATCDPIDQTFKFRAYTVTYSLVFPIGFLCNCVALYVLQRLTRKCSANTIFMINLAVSDISFSLTLPFRLVYYFRDGRWIFPDWLCRMCVFAFYLNLYTSVLLLTGLSVLRYLAIVHPLRNRKLVTVRRARWLCLGIWVSVALLSSPFFMSGTITRDDKVRCFEPGATKSWYRVLGLNYVALLLGLFVPLSTILACYGSIMLKLARIRGKAPKGTQRKRRRSVYLMAVILGISLLCFLPYHIFRSMHLYAKVHEWGCQLEVQLQRAVVVSLCLAASNSCFNPLLYYFAGESFRRTARITLRSTLSVASFSSLGHGSLRPALSRRRRSPMAQELPGGLPVPTQVPGDRGAQGNVQYTSKNLDGL